MATNDFLPFATGGSANVLTQAQWAALGALLNGFQSGIADSKSINKAFRQSSIMSAVLAQFIVDQTGANATDDGTTATLLTNLKKAMPGRLLRTSVYTLVGGVQMVSVNGGAFTATGANTFTPLSASTTAICEALGGGASGGGTGATGAGQTATASGGGAGSYGKSVFPIGTVAGAAITVGAGGAAAAAGANNGNAGGTSSIGAVLTAPGGAAGFGAAATISATSGGVGGAPTGANIVGYYGQPGGPGIGSLAAGWGGSSVYGAGDYPHMGANGGAQSGYGTGSGGAGSSASTAARPSGAANPGVVIIQEFA